MTDRIEKHKTKQKRQQRKRIMSIAYRLEEASPLSSKSVYYLDTHTHTHTGGGGGGRFNLL